MIIYDIIQKSLKILIFMFLADLIFVVSHLKIHPFKYFDSSDVIVVKKNSLLKIY